MLQNAPEFNSVGGSGWGGFGGNGFGLFGLLGLLGIGDLNGRRGNAEGDCCEDIKNNARNLAVLEAIQNNNNQTVAEGRALAAAICDSEKTNLQQFYAAAIQASNNTQAIKDQATAFAIVNDKRFDDLAAAGVTQTATILARINEVETQNLRDQLAAERRVRDVQEIKIENNNTNTQIQAQLQAQAQLQSQRDFDNIRRFDTLFNSFNQVNRTAQDIINLGTMTASGTQATNATNIK